MRLPEQACLQKMCSGARRNINVARRMLPCAGVRGRLLATRNAMVSGGGGMLRHIKQRECMLQEMVPVQAFCSPRVMRHRLDASNRVRPRGSKIARLSSGKVERGRQERHSRSSVWF